MGKVALVFSFEDPEDAQASQAILERIFYAARPELEGIADVKAHLASHEVAAQVVALFEEK